MKKQLLIAALATVTASTAFAQSKFEGFYGQAGVGYFSSSPSIGSNTLTDPSGTNYPFSSSINSSDGFNGAISGGYTFSLAKQFTLGLGVDYQPFASQEASYSFTNNSLSPSTSTGKWRVNNGYSVYLAPGYAITPDSLVYGKVGFAGAQMKATPTGGSSGTTNYTGYLLGLGYKQFISGGLYGFGEVNYSSYGSQNNQTTGPWTGGGTYTINTSASASSMNALVGVGYKF
jgi:outer membrane immunogenic protein